MKEPDYANHGDEHTHLEGTIILPAPTAWPMVLALGISLMLTGMVTHWVISLLGLMMALPAVVGWFFEVLPQDHHVYVDVHADVIEIKSSRETLAHMPLDERHRKLLPLETFSVMAGVKGGIAGGLAMMVCDRHCAHAIARERLATGWTSSLVSRSAIDQQHSGARA